MDHIEARAKLINALGMEGDQLWRQLAESAQVPDHDVRVRDIVRHAWASRRVVVLAMMVGYCLAMVWWIFTPTTYSSTVVVAPAALEADRVAALAVALEAWASVDRQIVVPLKQPRTGIVEWRGVGQTSDQAVDEATNAVARAQAAILDPYVADLASAHGRRRGAAGVARGADRCRHAARTTRGPVSRVHRRRRSHTGARVRRGHRRDRRHVRRDPVAVSGGNEGHAAGGRATTGCRVVSYRLGRCARAGASVAVVDRAGDGRRGRARVDRPVGVAGDSGGIVSDKVRGVFVFGLWLGACAGACGFAAICYFLKCACGF